ncbi:MAG TPA: tetratricopeptide repeat protein [Verrucomicrobiae bacterium]|nr:tetratricopeptide repeat protein [Verrucomicrobiae bacterium]
MPVPMDGKPLRILAVIVTILALAFPFVLGLDKISESDTFWHLKTGEWILSHSAVPRVDPFSATVSGKQWLDWEWLFQVAIYIVYTVGGFNAMVAWKAVIVGLAGLVVFFTCRRNGAGVALAALVMMAAFVASRARLEVRPDVLMLLLSALTICVLEAARRKCASPQAARRGRIYALLGLPIIELVWVNVHGSFLLGIGLVSLYALVLGIESILRKNWRSLGWIVAALALTCAACFANPFGIDLVRHAIDQTRASSPAGTIGEWQPTRELLLTEPNWALRVFWWLFWLNPLALVAVLAIKRREFPWAHALVVAAMSVLALRANRFTALYAVVTAPILAHGLSVIRARFAKKPVAWAEASAEILAGAVAAFLIFVTATNRWAIAESRPAKFGVGVDETIVPMKALDVMMELPPGLNVFNTFLSGGPLIWRGYPQWRPFCDGRANLYGREFVDQYRGAMYDPNEWEKWMRQRSVSVAFIQYGTADDRALLQYLVKSPMWDMLYFDHAACIFVHRSCWPQLRADNALKTLPHVHVTDAKAVLAYAHKLADEVSGNDPYLRARVVTTVGNFLMVVGAVDTAKALFEDAISLHPRPSEAWMNLAEISVEQGDLDRALELTDKLLEINPRYFYARLTQAQIKATKGNVDAALDEAESVTSEQPHSAQAWLLRAQLEARLGDRAGAIQALQRTIGEHVEDSHLYLFLGQLLAMNGRTNEAAQAYEKCLAIWRGPTAQRQEIEASLAKLRSPAAK